MKLACVVHRFGADIAGGSEGHCRLVAEHLSANHDVTIVTTCAKDHITWRNHYPAGESRVGGLRLLRFPVARPRNIGRFHEISDRVFADRASALEQEQWFRENGPDTPALLEFLGRRASDFDLVIFWAYRYYHAYFGVPLVGRASVQGTRRQGASYRVSFAFRELAAEDAERLSLTVFDAALGQLQRR